MSKQTKIMFYIASLYCVGLILVLVFGIYQIKVQGDNFESNRKLIAEQSAKEQTYNNIKQIITASAEDREALQKFFITEKDTISFISDIERIASNLGVTLETTQLSINPKTDKTDAQLYTGFKFSGSEVAIKQLVKLFENIPYHKLIPELVLTQKADTGEWEGNILIYITLAS